MRCLGVFFQSEARGCVVGKQVQAVVWFIFTFGCLSTRKNQKIKIKINWVSSRTSSQTQRTRPRENQHIYKQETRNQIKTFGSTLCPPKQTENQYQYQGLPPGKCDALCNCADPSKEIGTGMGMGDYVRWCSGVCVIVKTEREALPGVIG